MVGINEYFEMCFNEIRKGIYSTKNLNEKIEKFVDYIKKHRRIFLLASGRSLLVLKMFGVRLRQMGYDVYFLLDELSPRVNKEDLVIVLSGSGNTPIVVESLKKINSTVIGITSNKNGKILEYCKYCIVLENVKNKESDNYLEKYFPLGSLFEITSLLILEYIVSKIYKPLDHKILV